MANRVNKTREYLVDEFVKSLEEDRLPWYQGWINVQAPTSVSNKKAYRGVNRLILSWVAASREYSDHRWCTFNNAKKNGWTIKKGEKGTPIEMWKVYRADTKESLDFKEADKLLKEDPELKKFLRPYFKNYTVFNAEQIEGIPPLENIHNEINKSDFVENAVSGMDIPVIEGGDRCYYSPKDDEIHMPYDWQFKNDYEYSASLLHEMCHATGHENRLGRDMSGQFGTESYAKEELRAEIGSAFLMQDAGLETSQEHINSHKAYVQGWISLLKNNKEELFSAIKDADLISNYVRDCAEKTVELQKEDKSKEEEMEL